MNDETETAWDALQQSVFSDVKHFNYDIDTGDDKAEVDDVSIIAHTVGHRSIEILETQTNNIVDGGNNYVSTVGFDSLPNSDGAILANRLFESSVLNNSTGVSYNEHTKQLIVITVRGTVTGAKWLLNISEIFKDLPGRFATGKDIVMSTLYGRNIAKESCPYQSNHDTTNGTGCSYCVGY